MIRMITAHPGEDKVCLVIKLFASCAVLSYTIMTHVGVIFEFAHAIDVRMGHICAFETITSSKSLIAKQYKKHNISSSIIVHHLQQQHNAQTKTITATAKQTATPYYPEPCILTNLNFHFS